MFVFVRIVGIKYSWWKGGGGFSREETRSLNVIHSPGQRTGGRDGKAFRGLGCDMEVSFCCSFPMCSSA